MYMCGWISRKWNEKKNVHFGQIIIRGKLPRVSKPKKKKTKINDIRRGTIVSVDKIKIIIIYSVIYNV